MIPCANKPRLRSSIAAAPNLRLGLADLVFGEIGLDGQIDGLQALPPLGVGVEHSI